MVLPAPSGITCSSGTIWLYGLSQELSGEVVVEVFAFVLVIYLFVRLASTPSQVAELEEVVEGLQRRAQARPVPTRRSRSRRRVAGERRRPR